MKKYSIVLLVCLQGIVGFGQGNEKKESPNYLPTYVPPSPSVAALMKFEEVPVDNYTGVPNVSIPIYSVKSTANKINVDIALKYHPSSVAVEENASDVGLGWSLFAGGTISRTIKDLPDEALVYGKKAGIYQTSITGSKNNYYKFIDLISTGIQNSTDQYLVDEYLWEANEKKKYDTQHDLWQFNFMGFTGRFYIKKNMSTGVLEVEPLDNYTIKIINLYGAGSGYLSDNVYIPTGFIVIDSKGLKYYFEEYEETRVSSYSFREYYPSGSSLSLGDPNDYLKYRSAFHLTKVLDSNDNLLVDFKYTATFKDKTTVNKGNIYNQPNFDIVGLWNSIGGIGGGNSCPAGGPESFRKLEPSFSTFGTTIETNLKKIKDIEVNGIAKIHFNFESGRLDDFYVDHTNACKLKDITVSDWHDQLIKKYQLRHDYFNIIHNRLFLTGIDISGKNGIKEENYNLLYEKNNVDSQYIGKDYWGYYNIKPTCGTIDIYNVTPNFCTTEVLQKINTPSGGSIVFDYEPNRYSFIGPEAVTNFDENLENWTNSVPDQYHWDKNQTNVVHSLSYSATENQKVIFASGITQDDLEYKGISLYKDGQIVSAAVSSPNEAPFTCTNFILEAGAHYSLRFWNSDQSHPNGGGDIYVTYVNKSPVQKKYLYGGGIRIRKIGYFDKDVNEDYYRDFDYYSQLYTPSKEKIYNYTLKDDQAKSSGCLVFPKPIYKFPKQVETCLDCGGTGNSSGYTLSYDATTSFNNLLVNKTKGSDVGYKDVSVSEKGNGKTDYEYTTSLDHPEETLEYSSYPPFFPIENLDFKKGQLIKQVIYNDAGKIITEKTNHYEFVPSNKNIGLKVFSRPEKMFKNSYKFANFNIFSTYIDICKNPLNFDYNCLPFGDGPNPSSPNCPCHCYSGEEVSEVINFVSIVENFGWVKLTNTTTKENFYDGSATNTLETDETFTYNDLNQKIAVQTKTSSTGHILKATNFYPNDLLTEHQANALINKNMIDVVLKTEMQKGTEKLSEQKTIYKDWGNNLLAPEIIQVGKGNLGLENRLKFNIIDNITGNPLEIQQEGSPIKTVYIWGYNNSQPIAKIENVSYGSIPSSTIANLQTLSNAANNQPNLIIALNALRTSLPNAFVTTYTYLPLIGVSTITDPKGNISYYEYDAFNRLKLVKDNKGKILSENQYHYKTQN